MSTATRRGIASRRRALVAVAIAAVVTMTGCATKKDIRSLQEAIVQMQMHQDSVLQGLQRQNRLMLDTLRSSMALTLDTRGQTSHRFEQLNTLLESTKQVNSEILQSSRQLISGMSALEAKLAAMQMQNAQPAMSSPGSVPSGTTGAGSGGMTPEAAYQAGLKAMSDASYGSARTYFKAVISGNHDGALAPEARFQIGETYAREESYSDAYAAYESVASEWPAAARAPEALFRAATVARDAGDNTKARNYYNMVLRLYAKSESARLARSALAKLPK